MAIAIILAALLQVESPAAPAPEAPAVPATSQAEQKPALVCTMEPITGTRARKQKVCKTPGYEKGAERSKDMMRQIQNGSGNVQPTLPKGIGG
jgi:hypothetical protein